MTIHKPSTLEQIQAGKQVLSRMVLRLQAKAKAGNELTFEEKNFLDDYFFIYGSNIQPLGIVGDDTKT